MRTGYFKGERFVFGVRDANNELKEFYVFSDKIHLADPVLNVEITDEATRLAFFIKHYLHNQYYELDDDFIKKCEKVAPVQFIDVSIEDKEDE